MNKCSCYHEDYNRPECWGTKEREICSCGGDESKCDFYPRKRAASQAREVIENFNYKEIAKKLWTYICIIDDEKGTYEEVADAIGLTDDELAYCRRLEN